MFNPQEQGEGKGDSRMGGSVYIAQGHREGQMAQTWWDA